MKVKRIVRFFTALIFILLFSTSNISSAYQHSVPDTLTIICRKEDIVLSDMNWKIYKVAEITSRDNFEVVNAKEVVIAQVKVTRASKSVEAGDKK